jgi:hypothetical protein
MPEPGAGPTRRSSRSFLATPLRNRPSRSRRRKAMAPRLSHVAVGFGSLPRGGRGEHREDAAEATQQSTKHARQQRSQPQQGAREEHAVRTFRTIGVVPWSAPRVRAWNVGAPGRSRTCDPRIRSRGPVLSRPWTLPSLTGTPARATRRRASCRSMVFFVSRTTE